MPQVAPPGPKHRAARRHCQARGRLIECAAARVGRGNDGSRNESIPVRLSRFYLPTLKEDPAEGADILAVRNNRISITLLDPAFLSGGERQDWTDIEDKLLKRLNSHW